jgi:hypothetical protein
MKDLKHKLNAMNLDAILEKAVVTTEGGIAKMIGTIHDAMKSLEQICKK